MGDDDIVRFAYTLKRIYRRLDVWREQALQETPTELAILLYVQDQLGCRLKDLAAVLGLPLSTTSWNVDRLVKRRLLKRRTDPQDRRANLLALGSQGRRALEKYDEIYEGIAQVAAANLPGKEFRQALSMLTKFLASIDLEHADPTSSGGEP